MTELSARVEESQLPLLDWSPELKFIGLLEDEKDRAFQKVCL